MGAREPQAIIETVCLEVDNLLKAIHEFLNLAKETRDIELYQILDYFFE